MTNSLIIVASALALIFGLGLTTYVVWKLAPRSDVRAVSSAGVILVPVNVIESMEEEIHCLRERLNTLESIIDTGSDSEIIRSLKDRHDC